MKNKNKNRKMGVKNVRAFFSVLEIFAQNQRGSMKIMAQTIFYDNRVGFVFMQNVVVAMFVVVVLAPISIWSLWLHNAFF